MQNPGAIGSERSEVIKARRTRRFWIAVVAVVLVGGLLRFWALESGLPHLRTRPDELTVVTHTLKPARGEFDIAWYIYPNAYIYLCWVWGSAGLKAGHLLGIHPDQSYLTAFHSNPERIFKIGRALSARRRCYSSSSW